MQSISEEDISTEGKLNRAKFSRNLSENRALHCGGFPINETTWRYLKGSKFNEITKFKSAVLQRVLKKYPE